MANSYDIKGKSALNQNVMGLPFMKHFEESEVMNKVNKFRKGEKGLFSILKLIAFGGIAFGVFKWVLPAIFIAIGQTLAVVATIGIVILTVMCAPAIVRWMRNLARWLHKTAIANNPFMQFEIERKKIVQNNEAFTIASGRIRQIRSEMETEATNAEKDTKVLQSDILKFQGKAEKLKNELNTLVQERGVSAKGDDDYVEKSAELMTVLSESGRIAARMNQSKDFIQKYGSRGAVMKKLSQKLQLAEAGMKNKLADFDVTVDMLKKDFEFSQKSRAATDAAKSAMLFNKSWELEYAMEVVTNTIADDIAITSSNLKDIDSITANYALDSDELYDNLNLLANNIKIGKEELPEAKVYRNPDYKLTQDDKVKTGGLSNIFD